MVQQKRRRKTTRKKQRSKILLCSCGFLLVWVVFWGGSFFTTSNHTEHLSLPDILEEKSDGKSTLQNQQENHGKPVDTSTGTITKEADASDWNLLLVNPWNALPKDFSINLTHLRNGHAIDERAYPDLQNMMDDARALGLDPLICSSYRSLERQQELYEQQVRKYILQGYSPSQAQEEAGKWVAFPGTSEHQTGLAVDIVAGSYQLLDEQQENTAEQKWLMENAWKYGFVLRYPHDKSEITGIHYEPWHYRYVGKDAAKEMYEQGLCLEEYCNG